MILAKSCNNGRKHKITEDNRELKTTHEELIMTNCLVV